MTTNATCPYCGAETRPGDNFCLNCGNRLLSSTPSPQQQAQPVMGEPTLPTQDNWNQSSQNAPTISASGTGWADPAAMTMASTNPGADMPYGANAQAGTATAERPAMLILRTDNGDVVQEYPLEKPEISIGRAPNSDILLSKDKLTSRRHATILYENGKYILRDERSANGTFVNGQQLEEMATHQLQDGDHVGIGEHELIFQGAGSSSVPAAPESGVEDMPTISVQHTPMPEMTYRTREDELVTAAANDDFSTKSMDNGNSAGGAYAAAPVVEEPQAQYEEAAPATPEVVAPEAPVQPVAAYANAPARPAYAPSAPLPETNTGITFNSLTNVPQPSLPDIAPLLAALSTLDGQVTTLQEQLNTTQEAIRNHDTEISQNANQLRAGVRRVSDRMDNTIADVARSREALAWTDLIQLMEDVQNNPRDIEYVTKLARKARELNKVFQLHQSVLNTLAECNSLLRSLLGEDRKQ